MALLSDSLGLGGAMGRFDSYHGRTEGGVFHSSLRYPSPFFDIGHTYLPKSHKEMFRWCRYYFLVNPLINAVVYKMAEYPITPLIFEETDSEIKKKWEDIADNNLKLRAFQIEVGLDYFAYGNAFITIHYPFIKYLKCGHCGNKEQISKAAYKFQNLSYHLTCKKCHSVGVSQVEDLRIKNIKGIKLIRWNPEAIRVEHNEVTGQTDYFLDISQTIRNDVLMGKRHIIETIPSEFIDAIKKSKALKFQDGQLFHLKRPTIAQQDQGLGMPLILPVLKDTYYLQILRKGQEAVAQQHIVPLRIIFPQAGSNTSDPYSLTDLSSWRKRIEGELAKWRLDPNYMPILPLPVGNEIIGGEGKALMLHQEMRAWSEQIVAGMHVPIEFVFGGLQYSGSNTSMRMLENQFIGYRLNQHILINDFILGNIAHFMGWRKPKTRFKRFKMADDLQRSALVFQLNQAMKISDTTLLDDMDYDVAQEEDFKEAELAKQLVNQRLMQTASANLQGEMQVIAAKYQIQIQKLMQEAGMPQPAGPGAGQSQDLSSQMKQFAEGTLSPAGGAPVGVQDQQPDVGEEAAPGMPPNVVSYPEQGRVPPKEGIPPELTSPLGSQQHGYDVKYLARRAATELEDMDEMSRQNMLMDMKGKNPQLYLMVNQILSSGKGSQENPLDPMQSPLPEIKPPRRANSII